MFILNSTCDNASFLATVLFIKKLVKILSIVIPVILVLLLSMDMAKAVIASDDNQIKKTQSLAIKRIIYSLIIFFVPIVVNATFNFLGEKGVEGLACYNNADDVVVETLAQAEKESLLKYQEDIEKLIEAAKENKEAAEQALNELRQNASSGSGSSSSNVNSGTAEKIIQIAKEQAWPLGTSSSKYSSKYYSKKHSADCGSFTTMVVKKATGKNVPNLLGTMLKNKQNNSNPTKLNKAINKYGFTAYAWDGKMSSVRPGDIMTYKKSGYTGNGKGQHIMIYLGPTSDGKYLFAEASHPKHYYGHIVTKKSSQGQLKKSNYKYYYIIRATS